MAPSTYSHVDTVNGAKLWTIGQIQVLLSLNGRNFPCQFHVIEDMSHYAVLGRDFLLADDAIIYFTSRTLTLDNAYPIELTLNAETSRPMTNLLAPTNLSYNRKHDDKSPSFVTQLTPGYRCFVQQCKKASSFLLKFLIILLLMSPHGHATWANNTELSLAKGVSPLTTENSSLRPTSTFNNSREKLSVSSHFVFRLSHIRLKNSSSNTAVTPIIVCITLLQEIQVHRPNSNHRKRRVLCQKKTTAHPRSLKEKINWTKAINDCLPLLFEVSDTIAPWLSVRGCGEAADSPWSFPCATGFVMVSQSSRGLILAVASTKFQSDVHVTKN